MWQISLCTLIVLIKHLESLIGACAGYIRCTVLMSFSQNGAAEQALILFCKSELSSATAVAGFAFFDQER